MSRAVLITAALVLTPIAVAVAATNTGAFDWLSGDSASAALFASDMGPAAPSAEDSGVELGVTGAPLDCPPAGAGPEDSESLFQRQGENFWVRGTIASFDGATAVVTGPSGDISAILGPEFSLVGDLSPASAVEMAGTAASDGSMTAHDLRSLCAGAGVIDCSTEEDPHFQLRIEGNTFEVTGRLDSLTNDMISVIGPGLTVEIGRDSSTQIEGGLDPGDPVRVEGSVLDAQQLQALAVVLQCEGVLTATPSPASPAADAQADGDDDGEDEDDDGDDKDDNDENDDNDNNNNDGNDGNDGNEKCNPGEARGRGALRLKVHNGKAMIRRGAVLSQDGGTLSVDTPAGPVSVLVDDDTDIRGDLESAVDVWITGEMNDDESILAEEIKVLCSGHDDGNDGKEDKDDKRGKDEDEGDDDDDNEDAESEDD